MIATAECVTETPGTCPEDEESSTDEVNEEEHQQLRAAMMARQKMFAAGKGDLGRTDIVQHQINTDDHPPIKQRVRGYPERGGAETRTGHAGDWNQPGEQ